MFQAITEALEIPHGVSIKAYSFFSENAVGCREELCTALCCVDHKLHVTYLTYLPAYYPEQDSRHNTRLALRLLYFP